MTSLRTFARMLDATDPLRVEPVRVTVREPNARLVAILAKPGKFTAEEQAFVDACEREGGL